MTELELQQLVEHLSLQYFNRPFLHRATFNARLKTTGGRYHLTTSNIDFNYKVYEKFGLDEMIGVIKHELCHYHLHRMGLGYKHKDKDFKQLLKKVGGSRYVQNMDDNNKRKYICMACHQLYYRKRKINIEKYRCGKCLGKLIES